ncbi:hypothetical protein [Sporomusa aerivorans]|uniref:hypothetical protein n=1 Tax=Sporomusa aerivorans TaxID=204936 RepID=UPI003529EE06
MNKRFEGVYFGLQEILNNSLGRHVEFFDANLQNEEPKILEQFVLNKNENDCSMTVALSFSDASRLTLSKVVAATIDWGYLRKRTKPLVWLYEEKQDYIYKILFDVKNGVISSTNIEP